MKRKITILLLVTFLFLNIDNAKADSCDNANLTRLKVIANHVDISYEYLKNSEYIDNYSISISGLTDEIFVVNITDDTYHEWHAEDVNSGTATFESTEEELTFMVYATNCSNNYLRKITIKLPRYNYYSQEEKCKQVDDLNLDICDEWYQGELDDFTFHETIDKYIEDNKEEGLFNILSNYKYLLITAGIVVTISIVIFIILHRKRSVLE